MTGDQQAHLDESKARRARRAVFVDIEGVLQPESAIAGAHGLGTQSPLSVVSQIMQKCPQAFRYEPVLGALLSLHNDVVVVCSSLWRAFLSEDDLHEVFVGTEGRYAGSVGYPYQRRDFAIGRWLDSHPNIKDSATLSSHPVLHSRAWMKHIRCSPDAGLGDTAIQRELANWLRDTARDDTAHTHQPDTGVVPGISQPVPEAVNPRRNLS